MLGKLKALVTDLSRLVRNVYPVKGAFIRFQGAGASNPTVVDSYNCSVSRTGVGTYRITVTQQTAFGKTITDGVKTVSIRVAPTGTTAVFYAQATVISATVIDIVVYSVTLGASPALARTAYDIVAGDFVDFSVLVSGGNSRLPPG